MAFPKPLALFLLLALILLAGCTQSNPATNPPTGNAALPTTGSQNQNPTESVNVKTIAKGDTVQVNYRGTLDDGTEFDSSLKPGRTPLEFEVGAGQMIKGFDSAVAGMKEGEEKTVTLQPVDAYGEKRTDLIKTFSKEELGTLFDQIKVGQQLQATNGAAGTVTEKTATGATIDFNHPLAGKKLTFWIKIVKITKAS